MLRQLEERGLIKRIIDPRDRRNTFVCLTPAGTEMGERLREYLDSCLMRAVQMMGEDRFHEILAGIHELNVTMERAMEAMEKDNSTAEEET